MIGKYRWKICALLFFATTINYLDRQVLSLLKPSLEAEFGWSNVDYANIASAFQFSYAIALLFAGRFIDVIGTRKGYVWAIVIWSIGAIIHAFALPIGDSIVTMLGWAGILAIPSSVAGFIFARIILAIGEAGNFPAAVKATAEYFPKKERSFATGIFNSGANIGALIAPLSVPLIESILGWQAAFWIVGVIGFIWIFFWLRYYEDINKQTRLSPEEKAYILQDDKVTDQIPDPNEKQAHIPWSALLKHRQSWAFVAGKFITDGVWWFFLFWLPAYLYDQYGLQKTELMIPLAVLYSLTMIGSIGGGWLPAWFIKKDNDVYAARLKAMLLIAAIPLVVLLAQTGGQYSYWFAVLLIGTGAAAHQAWSANLFTTVSDMFPKKAVASIIGLGSMAGGIGGVLVTKTGGALFDHYKGLGHIETGYTIMFVYCSFAYLLAWLVIKFLVPRYKQVVV
jgi:ACS family hexuronate transporter-like MFS transporter